MTVVVNVFQFIFPSVVVSIAVILLCFYLHLKKKRAAYDITIPTPQSDNTSSEVYTISVSEDRAAEDRQYDTLPPRYSTVDPPPPYSLFDPKLPSLWPGGPPPDFEMYPITLPHHWRTPTVSPTPQPSSSPHNHPQAQRLHQASTS